MKKKLRKRFDSSREPMPGQSFDREGAESAAEETGDRYQALFERSLDMVYLHDFQGQFIDANPAALNALGYSKDELPGLNFASLLSPDQIPLALSLLKELQETGIQKGLSQFRIKTKDSRHLDVETKASVIYREGKPYAIQGVARDISEQLRMENTLRKSEANLKAIVDNSIQTLFLMNREKKIVTANKSATTLAKAILGRELKEGDNLYDLIRDQTEPEAMAWLETVFAKALQGETIDAEQKWFNIWWEFSFSPVFENDRVIGVCMSALNIHERKEITEALIDSEERLSALFQNSSDIIAVLEPDGKIRFISPSAERVLGYKPKQMTGKKALDFVYKEDRRYAAQEFDKLVQSPGLKKPLEFRFLKPDGTCSWLEIIVANLIGDPTINGMVLNGRDITERKKGQEALQQSEQRYRLLAENSADLIWTLSPELQFTYVSPAISRGYGYEPEELLGKHCREFMTPDSWKTVTETIRGKMVMERLSAQEPATSQPGTRLELEIICKHGSKVWTETVIRFLRDKDDKPIGLIGISRDITERRAAEQKIKESEKRYRLLAENVSDLIWTTDMNLKFTYSSPSIERMAGYTPEDMSKLSVDKVLTPESLQTAMKAFQEELAIEKSPQKDLSRNRVLELEQYRKDGSSFWTEVTVTFLRDKDDKPIGLIGISRDITERRAAEQKLRQSEERYRLLAENVSDVIWTMDMNLKFTYMSPSVFNLRGYTPEQVLNQPLNEIMSPDSVKMVVDTFKEALELEKSPQRDLRRIWRFEVQQPRKDGSLVWTESTVSFLRDQNNQAIGILGATRDISERKRAEAERQKLLVSMAQTDKLASLGQFAAGMAHEINNPLAYIKANLKVLDEYRKNISELFQAYDLFVSAAKSAASARLNNETRNLSGLKKDMDLEGIMTDFRGLVAESEEGVERIKNIIQSLKKFAEPPKVIPEYADPNSIIESTLNLVEGVIRRKASLKKELGIIPRIKCYPEELSQVFINLLTNALNAIKTFGEISICTEALDGVVKIKIRDTGVGMSPEQMAKVFDPFYTTQGIGKGRGLGLSVSYGIVKKHGGEIRVESEPGKGSTFTVELPAGE